jgi:hypothetical protein
MCDFRRELPLGEGFNEWERAFAERIPALGEGPESSRWQMSCICLSGVTSVPALLAVLGKKKICSMPAFSM